jgi:hypothetical protein
VDGTWSAAAVLALAPDAASALAGQGLAAARVWSEQGAATEPAAVWGLCQGSGKRPYQVAVDLDGPAYKCSCPSRKIPCKHVLGLLLRWSAGGVEPGTPPPWVAEWLAAREQRDGAPAPRAERAERDPAAAARRAEQRAARVAAGLDELDRWLRDQVRTGLAGVRRGGYQQFDAVAARMVDAQAPALAGALRRLPEVTVSGPDWPDRLLAELARLHLIVAAHRRLDTLPADLRATVRARVGYPVAQDDVLAGPPVADRWAVLALRDFADDRLVSRRVWLAGTGSGRLAMILSYAPAGGALDATLLPGTVLDADLHFYPGAAALRALVGARRGEPVPLRSLTGGGIAAAVAAYAAAVAADPWLTSWPAVLAGVVPVPGDPWQLAEPGGTALSIVDGSCDPWRLLALSGGRPLTIAVEYTVDGVRPLSVVDDGRLVAV